jgi:hypothetical protein
MRHFPKNSEKSRQDTRFTGFIGDVYGSGLTHQVKNPVSASIFIEKSDDFGQKPFWVSPIVDLM